MLMNVVSGKKFLGQVNSFEEASKVFFTYRMETHRMRGVPDALVISTEGETLAKISPNGRVWEVEDDTKCLYDPYDRDGK